MTNQNLKLEHISLGELHLCPLFSFSIVEEKKDGLQRVQYENATGLTSNPIIYFFIFLLISP